MGKHKDGRPPVTASTSEDGSKWEGFGTSIKPAYEPILLARKPFKGTVVSNVLAHGTGALNVDASRIGTEERFNPASGNKAGGFAYNMNVYGMPDDAEGSEAVGRFPANVLLAHDSECKVSGTEIAKGHKGYPNGPGGKSHHYSSDKKSSEVRPNAWKGPSDRKVDAYECVEDCPVEMLNKQKEGVSRFFYCSKSSKKERNAGLPDELVNTHPTVKPVDLMEYLVRLVTPPKGIVLDPYVGSGSTFCGAVKSGFGGIGIDLDEEDKYLTIAEHRIKHYGGEVQRKDLNENG